MSAPVGWLRVVPDEDDSVPQTGGGQAFLAGAAVRLTDPALVVLADVVDALDRLVAPDARAREAAIAVADRLAYLYGFRTRLSA